ncbi:MAG: alpha/beta hydrolase fold domain-containing protein [Sandaracinaceae bacterium]
MTLPPARADCTLSRDAVASVERGLVYASHQGAPLHLDLATPVGPGPHPFIVLIHGGGWRAGERAHMDAELDAFAALGYAAASVDYRLLTRSDDNRFPAQIADVRCAVRYLRRHAGRLHLDPERAAALGYSSGGHLALLLGTGADVSGLDDDVCEDTETSSGVAAVVAFFGVAELRTDASFPRPSERLIERLIGGPRAERLDLTTLASPIAHIDARDAPTLLFHATDDPVVPVAQSRRMRAALSGAGVPVRYVEVPGRRHGFRVFPRDPGPDRTVACTTLGFLDAVLRTPRDASRNAASAGSQP